MFLSIHAETDPHNIKTSSGLSEKYISHTVFNLPRKRGSPVAIHDISSKTMMVLPVGHCFANNLNRSPQSSGDSEKENCALNWRLNSLRWSWAVMVSVGGNPIKK